MRSSSGVLVKDRLGSKYMTTAAHKFPFDKNVYHPSLSGAIIGKFTTGLTHTDITLMKLGDGVDFVNEPFGNTSTLASPFRLGDFIRMAETKRQDLVFLDSPFTGLVEGKLMSKISCVFHLRTKIRKYRSKPNGTKWGKTQLMSWWTVLMAPPSGTPIIEFWAFSVMPLEQDSTRIIA